MPTQEEVDRALNEIKGIFANREAMIAEAYANHPDPDAWSLHFINCLSMIVQGPLSKIEDSGESGSVTKAVKRRRVDDEEIPQGIRSGGRVFESEEETTYKFTGPTKFRVETQGSPIHVDILRTCLNVHGHTKVYIEDADQVEVISAPKKFTFAKTTDGQEPKKAPAVKTEKDSKKRLSLRTLSASRHASDSTRC